MKRSKQFSESGHDVEYQIKGSDAYNNMLAHSLPVHTTDTGGWVKRSKQCFESGRFVYQKRK